MILQMRNRGSEEKIGRAFDGIRHNVMFATKTLKRDAKCATEHLENSLRLFKADYIDLYQLHQVAQEKDWDAAKASDGVFEAIVKAREQGKIRFTGVTSHSRPIAVKLVKKVYLVPFSFPLILLKMLQKMNFT